MIDILKQYEEKELIKSQKHPTEDLIIWNYTPKVQYDPELWDKITLMCRGLITDSYGDIIERPFDKFFNHGEVGGQPGVVTCKSVIQEKLDGSLGILYWVRNEPYIATRDSFISEQAQFANQFIQDNPDVKEVLKKIKDKNLTHLFEIIYPENRIVVDYKGRKGLTYLCSVYKRSSKSIFLEDLGVIPKAATYTPTQFERIMKDQPKGQDFEGFVVYYTSRNIRVKHKLLRCGES